MSNPNVLPAKNSLMNIYIASPLKLLLLNIKQIIIVCQTSS